jgi:hypothetical protein
VGKGVEGWAHVSGGCPFLQLIHGVCGHIKVGPIAVKHPRVGAAGAALAVAVEVKGAVVGGGPGVIVFARTVYAGPKVHGQEGHGVAHRHPRPLGLAVLLAGVVKQLRGVVGVSQVTALS